MNLLFDTSPGEVPDQKKARARKLAAPPQAAEQAAEKAPLFIGKRPLRAILPIGKIDDTFVCIDDRCGAECHDILHEDSGEWLLGCCFCNSTQWVRAIPGHIKPKEHEFVFRDGRFAGMSIDEAAVQPRGMDYIEWAAKSHTRPSVKAACQTWLDRRHQPA
jgi:hypothetical protein